jgi:hypothetical protein
VVDGRNVWGPDREVTEAVAGPATGPRNNARTLGARVPPPVMIS